MKRLMLTTAIAVCCSSPIQSVSAQNIEPLKPRIEGNWRYSNDRSIYMSEIWVPLAQNEQDGSVLFGDVRIMGDNNSNNEFNAGVGYREIINTRLLGEGIIGGMVWYDRRQTARDSEFNQVTVGGEWLSNNWDVRVNGYLPLNDAETHTQANPNGAGAGFVGNQLLVNTDQTITEEALHGGDIEVGYKLGFLDGITDATRIYAGGYHFEGDRVEDVSGWRTRFTSDITSDIQVGARYQHDDVRGSQTYVEATIRLPFGNKKSYQEHGLRSRLDEAPERDIDIVSNEAVIDAGLTNTQLLNAQTGLAQNIIHVDNTNGGAEDGSIDNPYNTLAEAEAVAGVNDLIYVHRGDGTTMGMNVGITLDDAGQMLAGSGADLEFSRDRFRVAGGGTISQPIIAATQAPVITNGGGSGIIVDADDVFVSGVTVDGATGSGILMVNDDNLVVDGVTIVNSTANGVRIRNNGATINRVAIYNSTIANNAGNAGIIIDNENNGVTGIVTIQGNTVTGNVDGIEFLNDTGATLETANINNNHVSGTVGEGIFFAVLGGAEVENANFNANTVSNNGDSGIQVRAANTGSVLTNISAVNNVTFDNGSVGLSVFTFEYGGDGQIDNVLFEGNTSYGNGSGGLVVNDNVDSTDMLNVDLGGGSLGSRGQNSSYDNGTDLSIDVDGGRVSARRNWWGDGAGLSSEQLLLEDDSTVDTSQPLQLDPNQ